MLPPWAAGCKVAQGRQRAVAVNWVRSVAHGATAERDSAHVCEKRGADSTSTHNQTFFHSHANPARSPGHTAAAPGRLRRCRRRRRCHPPCRGCACRCPAAAGWHFACARAHLCLHPEHFPCRCQRVGQSKLHPSGPSPLPGWGVEGVQVEARAAINARDACCLQLHAGRGAEWGKLGSCTLRVCWVAKAGGTLDALSVMKSRQLLHERWGKLCNAWRHLRSFTVLLTQP